MKRVLLFGGSGFLGRAFFKELHPYMDVYAPTATKLNLKAIIGTIIMTFGRILL